MEKIVSHPAFRKAWKIIDSCDNMSQLHTACRFAEQVALFIKNDISKGNSGAAVMITAIRAYDMTIEYLNDIAVEKKRELNKEIYNIK